jgi:hypothetical protein
LKHVSKLRCCCLRQKVKPQIQFKRSDRVTVFGDNRMSWRRAGHLRQISLFVRIVCLGDLLRSFSHSGNIRTVKQAAFKSSIPKAGRHDKTEDVHRQRKRCTNSLVSRVCIRS